MDRIVLGKHQRRRVGPVAEHRAILEQNAIEFRSIEGTESAEENQQLGSRNRVDGIELDTSKPCGYTHDIPLAALRR